MEPAGPDRDLPAIKSGVCSNLKSEDPSPLGMLRCADLLPSSRQRGAWACRWDPGRPVPSLHQGFGPDPGGSVGSYVLATPRLPRWCGDHMEGLWRQW